MVCDPAKRTSLYRRLVLWLRGQQNDATGAEEIAIADAAVVIDAILKRERAGEPTTLRQLHKASQLTQPQALRVLGELERAGLVVIERNNVDAFESVITLGEEFRERIEQNSIRDAA